MDHSMVRELYLIGAPIEHSISPHIHNTALKQLNLQYRYESKHVSTENLANFMDKIKTEKLLGFNVTIPLKTQIMQYLDKVSTIAQEIGAVNTVKYENSELIGRNTDIIGIETVFEHNFLPLRNGAIIILMGAGGAARSVSYYLSQYDVNLVIANRSLKNAKNLQNKITSDSSNNSDVEIFTMQDLYQHKNLLENADLIINATPIGMWPYVNADPLSDYIPHQSQCVFDLIYNPLETKLIQKSKMRKCKAINGLEMLIYQAVAAFKWWTGFNPDVSIMKKAAEEALGTIFSK
jgi:shikimate dehydrogenase